LRGLKWRRKIEAEKIENGELKIVGRDVFSFIRKDILHTNLRVEQMKREIIIGIASLMTANSIAAQVTGRYQYLNPTSHNSTEKLDSAFIQFFSDSTYTYEQFGFKKIEGLTTPIISFSIGKWGMKSDSLKLTSEQLEKEVYEQKKLEMLQHLFQYADTTIDVALIHMNSTYRLIAEESTGLILQSKTKSDTLMNFR
jgi:hypothetical protein